MNKILIFFSLFLVASMCFVTMSNTAHADSQLDIQLSLVSAQKCASLEYPETGQADASSIQRRDRRA